MSPKDTKPFIIFDWDGTVMDSVARIVSSMQNTARELDLPIPTSTAVKDIIGISLMPAIERLFGTLTETQLERFFAVYRHYYIDADQTPSPLFSGAAEAIQQLHADGFILAVATGKARHGLERVWAETGSGAWFHFSRCADEAESKPHPKMLHDLLGQSGYSAQQAIMVGDSVHDLRMAANAGVAAIGVTFGAHPRERLRDEPALCLVDSWAELLAVLMQQTLSQQIPSLNKRVVG